MTERYWIAMQESWQQSESKLKARIRELEEGARFSAHNLTEMSKTIDDNLRTIRSLNATIEKVRGCFDPTTSNPILRDILDILDNKPQQCREDWSRQDNAVLNGP